MLGKLTGASSTTTVARVLRPPSSVTSDLVCKSVHVRSATATAPCIAVRLPRRLRVLLKVRLASALKRVRGTALLTSWSLLLRLPRRTRPSRRHRRCACQSLASYGLKQRVMYPGKLGSARQCLGLSLHQ
nr:uncharacterized protein LOC127294870 isoform X2 [Lolium perenne]